MIMTIDYIKIEDFVRLLPHEQVSRMEVKEIITRLKRRKKVKPITVYGEYILDGHHRWNAIKYLYENDQEWRDYEIPVCHLEDFEVMGVTKQQLINAAESGELYGYKHTHTTPRGPEAKMQIKKVKK